MFDKLPDRVSVYEVAMRDGLQNETVIVPTTKKLRLVEALAASGLSRIELTSFVSPKWLDAMGFEKCDWRLEALPVKNPLGEDTSVGRFLAGRGPGVHHVAFTVSDVGAAVRDLRSAGADVIDPEPRPGLGGHSVSFVHPDSVHGVLVEVLAHG